MTDEIKAKWLGFNSELHRLMSDAQIRAIAKSGPELLAIHRNMNLLLLEALHRHDRELRILSGEKVEPVAHEGAAVVRVVTGFTGG